MNNLDKEFENICKIHNLMSSCDEEMNNLGIELFSTIYFPCSSISEIIEYLLKRSYEIGKERARTYRKNAQI